LRIIILGIRLGLNHLLAIEGNDIGQNGFGLLCEITPLPFRDRFGGFPVADIGPHQVSHLVLHRDPLLPDRHEINQLLLAVRRREVVQFLLFSQQFLPHLWDLTAEFGDLLLIIGHDHALFRADERRHLERHILRQLNFLG